MASDGMEDKCVKVEAKGKRGKTITTLTTARLCVVAALVCLQMGLT